MVKALPYAVKDFYRLSEKNRIHVRSQLEGDSAIRVKARVLPLTRQTSLHALPSDRKEVWGFARSSEL